MVPAVAVKLLRDGVDSANFLGMKSLNGQDSLNFFANDFSNHIEGKTSSKLKPLEARFAIFTDYYKRVGLSNMAKYD